MGFLEHQRQPLPSPQTFITFAPGFLLLSVLSFTRHPHFHNWSPILLKPPGNQRFIISSQIVSTLSCNSHASSLSLISFFFHLPGSFDLFLLFPTFPLLLPFVLVSSSFLLPPIPPSALSPSVSFSAIIPGHHCLVTLLLLPDLRNLRPLLETEERTELLRTCFKGVLCLPPRDILRKEASSSKEAQANLVINFLMCLFGFIYLFF